MTDICQPMIPRHPQSKSRTRRMWEWLTRYYARGHAVAPFGDYPRNIGQCICHGYRCAVPSGCRHRWRALLDGEQTPARARAIWLELDRECERQ